MGEVKWTKEQEDVIHEKNKNILVSAAAGSGKTAVLVERIINKIINEKVDIDKILVVTFTNAAASEMRERILDAIYKKLDETPDNQNLQRQITLLGKATICTIDSFCLEVVRNNFYELENISPNFRIGDTTEIELLKQEVIEEIFEEKYEEHDKDFIELINTYTDYKDDSPLKELILKIYTYIQSNPFPMEWLNEKIEMFNLDGKLEENFANTIWGNILLKDLEEELVDSIANLRPAQEMLEDAPELDVFYKIIRNDIDNLERMKNNINNWDELYEISKTQIFVRWSNKKSENEAKIKAKEIRDIVKEKIEKVIEKTLISNSKDANQDINDMYKVLNKLENLIIEFDEQFSKKKREKNIVDFNDIEHLALNILLNKDSNVAKNYQEKFEEVAIDEYQDSNLVQEYILSSVSKGNNMLMVGDVKQSIYKFRQAMPKLFLDKYSKYKLKEEIKENEDLKIQLFKNFRSRENILEFTNLIFQDIMSEKLGEIDYTSEEYLNLGANYLEPKQDLKTEINVINLNEEIEENKYKVNDDEDDDNEENEQDEERIENIELEARFVANKIKQLINSKFQVWDKDKKDYRNIEYRDIVILLRATSNVAPVYEEELLKQEMPVFSDASQEYLDSIEIQTIMSLLKIIDNPIQDIPLVTVMRSNIGKFTDDELVEIRLSDKHDNFYNCMQKAKVNVNEELKNKIDTFLNNLNKWRKEQEYLALDELIWKIYMDTGYYNYVSLMPNGVLRVANLKMLFERAKQYEKASFKGLYNFINFIEKLRQNSGDLGAAKIIGENDNVIRIMSIHKSKGLEFPVVFLSNTGKQFNLTDFNKSILLHQDLGLGVKYINYKMQIYYDTLAKLAIKNKMLLETMSEEMRILYVALTRAKEKLFIVGIEKNFEKKTNNLENYVKKYEKIENKINPILIKQCKSYLDWILLVYFYEKNNLQDLVDFKVLEKSDVKAGFEVTKKEEIDVEKILEEQSDDASDSEKMEKIKEILNYKYKYSEAVNIPTKTSVTELKNLSSTRNTSNISNKSEDIKVTEKIFPVPNFIKLNEEEKITPAMKGTIMHLCMQNLDEKQEYDLEKVKELINSLTSRGIITKLEAESINPSKILSFTQSNIWSDLKEAKEVYKEKPFYINVPASEVYDIENLQENILVQGIIDLYYIDKEDNLVLLDYKTDFVEQGKEEELVRKYGKQLELYKMALENALNRKVNKVYIYSVYLGKEITY